MTILVPVALFGWIPISLLIFAFLPPRRAVVWSILLGWLFLPVAGYEIVGLPDYTKWTAVSLGAFLGVLLFDSHRLALYRFRWFDLPAILWVLAPLPSALANGMGFYEGASAALSLAISYGIPWLLGRVYFRDVAELRELGRALILGGLIYMPLCWFEMRMSPRLHINVYGAHQHLWKQARREGGWRPTVFLQHGLAVSQWMAASAVLAVSMGLRSRQAGGSRVTRWAVPLLLGGTTLLCRSSGAAALMILGVVCTVPAARRWSGPLLVILSLAVPGYVIGRLTGAMPVQSVLEAHAAIFSPERVESLRVRLEQEEAMRPNILQSPVVGWGPSGRYREDEFGEDSVKATDSAWIIFLGKWGLLGLSAFFAMHLLPALKHISRRSVAGDDNDGPRRGLAVILVLFMLDCLTNAMMHPFYMLAAGALLCPVRREAARR